MTGINVDYINPFLMAATGIIKDICQIEMKIGKPYVKRCTASRAVNMK